MIDSDIPTNRRYVQNAGLDALWDFLKWLDKNDDHIISASDAEGVVVKVIGYSWGGYESLVVPVDPAPYRSATPWPPAGMDPGDRFGVRLSVGLEDPADLIADLEQAFAAMAAS